MYERDKASNITGTSLCTCAYKGKIYVFYDYINPKNWRQRYICYKTSSDPENIGWAPDGGEKIKIAKRNLYMDVKWGNDSERPLLTATVLDGKLYLFYAKTGEQNIHVLVFDNQEWKTASDIDCGKAVQAISAQTVITNKGNGNDENSVIAIAVRVKNETGDRGGKIHVITYNEKSYQKSLTWAEDINRLW